jgi:hypothetical protein
VGFNPGQGTSAPDAAALRHIQQTALTNGARPALLFAALVVGAGALLSFLIPRFAPPMAPAAPLAPDAPASTAPADNVATGRPQAAEATTSGTAAMTPDTSAPGNVESPETRGNSRSRTPP